VTAKDVGIHAQSLKIIKRKTRHVLGIDGEPGSSGDPSLATAWGVYHGMRACAQFAFQAKSLKGLKIALQGLGCVSYDLLEHLVSEGAIVIGCDIHPQRVEKIVKKYSIEIVSPERIYDVECDIFSPSALGSSIRPETLERIQAKVIAGAANNQLASPEQGYEIMRRGIVYAPDYVINAGGLINVYYENPKEGSYNRTLAFEHVSRIGGTLTTILERAQDENLPSDVIADRLVDERIQLALKKRNSSALR
jgi:leucine dehydrogenase